MFRKYAVLYSFVSAFLLINSTAQADSSGLINLGERIASADEIVGYLKPEVAVKPIRTRGGIYLTDTETPEHRPVVISLQVNFAFDSDQLTRHSIQQLKPMGMALASNELQSLTFYLEGHTDAKGSDAYNIDLSNRRADSVKTFFMHRFGIGGDRISALGKGERNLLDPSRPNSGKNRRVTISASYQAG